MPVTIKDLDKYLQDREMNRIIFSGIDYTWGFRENEPVIGIINKDDEREAFLAAMSLYWALAEFISKPWCLLVVAEVMAPQHRQMLDNLSKQYNIKVVKEEKVFSTVFEQLICLIEILQIYIDDPKNPVRSLGESIKRWKEEKTTHEYRFNVVVEIGKLEAYMEKGKLVPSRKTIPLTILSGSIRKDSILFRLVKTEGGLFFDTEHRNLPTVMKLNISEQSELVLRFEADKSNITEATSFWNLYGAFIETKRLAFIEPNTGDMMFSCVRELNDRGTKDSSR